MKVSVSLAEKKQFLRWFLNNHFLKNWEGRWILNYLLNEEHALTNVKFIQHAEFCPRGLYLSSKSENGSPLMFYKGKISTIDGSKPFHDIRMNNFETMYVELDYESNEQCSMLALVEEENPFLPEDFHSNEREKNLAGEWLDHQLILNQKETLLSNIDKALDTKDEVLFKQLSEQYTDLKNRMKKQGME
ncbi:ReoY family proteolytic degradation factor [Salimicrobium flavidum]|uniref:UPF0302 protein SAMN05421687_101244 n=1 Tax=Salimicrobium flavidum TaxID=570947 RepID=A0A1N7IJ94_9BACI|nr:ReoY family proteolytic degradation factor [Salimicrobium flavidum]SIS37159.1 Uncharacterized protein YpiB, UPF0302 family [Salimicrobium flavidum]